MRPWWMTAALVLGICAMAIGAEKKPDPVLAPVADDLKLPRVLLIGDSISMGYTLPLRELLAGKANLHRPPTNCGDTTRGIKSLDDWLGEKKWDVIHFNFGLHDLKYVDDKGTLVSVEKGKQVMSPEQYEKNLRQIVERLKKTNAKLIFATTTPVPDASAGRVKGDEVKYNAVAEKVMKETGVEVDDLYGFVMAHPAMIQPRNVHYTKDGYKALAEQAAKVIEKALLAGR
jgi:lysophospholipase L1-like esterase